MCHRRSARARSPSAATDEEPETEDAPGWWGARAAARIRSLVAGDRGERSRERSAPGAGSHGRVEPDPDPGGAEGAEDDADDEREREEPIPAGD